MSKKKDKLFEDCCEEVLKEAWGAGGSTFGGAGGGSDGSFSYTQAAGAKTWSPGSPPHRGMTGSPGGLNTKDLGEESEEFAKQAGRNLPFPLDLVHDGLVQAFIGLENSKAQLHTCVKYNKIFTTQEEKKALLDFQMKKLETIQKMIEEVSSDIDRATLL